jgi:hypothetical protein
MAPFNSPLPTRRGRASVFWLRLIWLCQWISGRGRVPPWKPPPANINSSTRHQASQSAFIAFARHSRRQQKRNSKRSQVAAANKLDPEIPRSDSSAATPDWAFLPINFGEQVRCSTARTTTMNNRTLCRFFATAVLICLTASTLAQTISIPDSGLDAAIRDALHKPTGPLSQQDRSELSAFWARILPSALQLTRTHFPADV